MRAICFVTGVPYKSNVIVVRMLLVCWTEAKPYTKIHTTKKFGKKTTR